MQAQCNGEKLPVDARLGNSSLQKIKNNRFKTQIRGRSNLIFQRRFESLIFLWFVLEFQTIQLLIGTANHCHRVDLQDRKSSIIFTKK